MLMDSVSEGAVLVSFGSALKPEQMPAEKIQVFVDTFKNLGMKVVQYIQHMTFFSFNHYWHLLMILLKSFTH